MDSFNNHVLHIILKFRHHNNVKKKLNHAKNIKLLTIVYQKTYKILNNKFSTTGQLLQSFQFIEISLFTKKVFIKFIQETKDFQLVRQLKLLVGMLEMAKHVGLLKTVGEKNGDKMVSGNYYFNI